MDEREKTRLWWVGFGATGAFAFVLSVLAYAGRLPGALFEADKAIHFGVAGVLAFCLDGATRHRSLRPVATLALLFAVDEVAQRWSAHRSSSLGDYAADLAGVVVFTWLSRRVSKTGRAKPADDVAE